DRTRTRCLVGNRARVGERECVAPPAGGRRCDGVSGAAGRPGTGGAALERAPLVLAHGAPHAGVLAAVERPGQATAGHGAASADGLGLGDLQESGTAGPYRKEQLRVLVAADSAVAPIHVSVLLVRAIGIASSSN